MILVAILALPFAAIGLLIRAPGAVGLRIGATLLVGFILGLMLASWLAAGWKPGSQWAWLAGPVAIMAVLDAMVCLILLFSIHAGAAMLIVATIGALAFYLTSWD